jgi:hypothetical protein
MKTIIAIDFGQPGQPKFKPDLSPDCPHSHEPPPKAVRSAELSEMISAVQKREKMLHAERPKMEPVFQGRTAAAKKP